MQRLSVSYLVTILLCFPWGAVFPDLICILCCPLYLVVFSDDHYIGGPVDIWALGVLLYFMVIGNMPFRAPTVPHLRTSVLRGDFSLPGTLSLPCIRLIRKYLCFYFFNYFNKGILIDFVSFL